MRTMYLDACCINRPFDDQSQPRVRLEAEAVLLLLAQIERGKLRWIGSNVLEYEISRTPDSERRQRVQRLLSAAVHFVAAGAGEETRAAELETLGFGAYDSLHLACAEGSEAEVFLTTDDGLLRRARRCRAQLRIRVENPLDWLNKRTDE